MDAARGAIADQDERDRVELCVRVLECVECFSIQKFLVSLARTHEDQSAITKTMEKKMHSTGSMSLAGRLTLLAALAGEEAGGTAPTLTGEGDHPPHAADQSAE
jgi:hypothetical protein